MPCCPACLVEHAPGTERCPACEIDLGERPQEDQVDGEGPPPGSLVTVATFDLPLNATLLARRLEAQGIECFIADAEIVGVYNLLSGAVGGVKVQVRESDASRAAALIREGAAVRPAAPSCPRCGSMELRRRGLPVVLAFLLLLIVAELSLFLSVHWECQKCRHRWK